MVRLNLSLDNVRNCEETTMFGKECKNKGILNLANKQGLLFKKNIKSLITLKKYIRKME